jgi:hypothetical protein
MPDVPGLLVPGTVDLSHRPRVKNLDGSISTVRSIGVNVDGHEVLIPTVTPDGRMLTPSQAVQEFRKTGQHLGIFDTPQHATAYAEQLHAQQAGSLAPSWPGPSLDGLVQAIQAVAGHMGRKEQ